VVLYSTPSSPESNGDGKPVPEVTLSMGHMGASRKAHNDALQVKMLSHSVSEFLHIPDTSQDTKEEQEFMTLTSELFDDLFVCIRWESTFAALINLIARDKLLL